MIIIINPKEEAFTLWAAASGCWCCWTFSNLAIMMAMIDSSSPQRVELSVYSRIRIFTCAKAFSNILCNTCPPPPIIIFLKTKNNWGWLLRMQARSGSYLDPNPDSNDQPGRRLRASEWVFACCCVW